MAGLRLLVFVVAALMIASPVYADPVDVKIKGQWDFAFGWNVHSSLRKNNADNRNDDAFMTNQRVRTQINFITSEALQAVLVFEVGDLTWGDRETGAGIDADGVNVETKRAYLDWQIPTTEATVRMGIQGLALPMANDLASPVFSADVAGITVGYKFNDLLAVSVYWARPFDQYSADDIASRSTSDEMDMFGTALAFSGDGWSVTPWGMYSYIGNAAGLYDYLLDNDREDFSIGGYDGAQHTNAWWVGVSNEISLFDPLTFGFDAIYGRINATDYGLYDQEVSIGRTRIGTEGWFVTAALNYQLDWAVPGIFGWYGSGDDKDSVRDGKFGRMPVVGINDGWGYTSFGFPGGFNIGTDTAVALTGMGTWGLGVQLAELSFIDNLSHTLRFAYYRGTNDSDLVKSLGGELPDMYKIAGETEYLTNKDYVLEVNFDHTYQIYENLTAVMELGWLKLNLDDKTWRDHDTTNAWKAQVLLQYSF